MLGVSTAMHEFVCKIYDHFEEVTDFRINRGCNHPLLEMVFLTLCATISDCNCWVDVERFGKTRLPWLRNYLPFENGVPSHDTLGRVFSRLDSVPFYAALTSFSNEIAQSVQGQTVAIDGKTLRGSHDLATGKSALHSVSAWACALKLCIGLKSVDDKSNEIPAVQELIEMLDLQGAVVTADAMHCQKETAELLLLKGADYILFAKGNQPKLKAEIDRLMLQAMDDEDKKLRRHRTVETNRGREEIRDVYVLPAPVQNAILKEWEGISSIGLIHRSIQDGEKFSEETSLFISSRPAKVKDLAKRVREHWGIENSQHYILDVTFGEDASRIRNGNSPEISSVFRRLALNILQQDTSIKDNIRGKRKRCGFDTSALESILASFA